MSCYLFIHIQGARGTGKTALAAKLAAESDFPLVRLVSPDSMIGMQDHQKCQLLLKVNLFFIILIFLIGLHGCLSLTPFGHFYR